MPAGIKSMRGLLRRRRRLELRQALPPVLDRVHELEGRVHAVAPVALRALDVALEPVDVPELVQRVDLARRRERFLIIR